jgi:hypothetical protein
MSREEPKRKASARVQVSMQSTGTELLVVALKPAKAGGAKGQHRSVVFVGQPLAGGAHEHGK